MVSSVRAVVCAVLLAALVLVPASPAAANAANAGNGDRQLQRVAYFVQWGIYARQYFVKNVETSGSAARLTTLNYAFGNVSQDGSCFEANQAGQGDAWADYQRPVSAQESVDGIADTATQPLAGSFNQLRELKALHPNLHVLLSLGGFSWSKFFSDAALTPASRERFVASCIDLFIKGNLPNLDGGSRGGPGSGAGVFDGFDIDWEWPASAGADGNVVRPQDKHDLTLLLAEFRRQLDALGRQTHRHYQLTEFLPADPAKVAAGFEVPAIFHFLDFATVQGYDLHGTWETTTNHQSSLFAPPGDPSPVKFSVDLAIRAYLSRGAPPRRLVLGVPFYSRGWTGVPAAGDGLFQTSTGPAPGVFEAGIDDYKAVASLPGFTVFRDRRDGVAWLYDGTTFWTFDDPRALSEKMAYVRDRRLGGAMAWSLDGDDAGGSLIRAVDRGLRSGED